MGGDLDWLLIVPSVNSALDQRWKWSDRKGALISAMTPRAFFVR
jgi:hypothetical protein